VHMIYIQLYSTKNMIHSNPLRNKIKPLIIPNTHQKRRPNELYPKKFPIFSNQFYIFFLQLYFYVFYVILLIFVCFCLCFVYFMFYYILYRTCVQPNRASSRSHVSRSALVLRHWCASALHSPKICPIRPTVMAGIYF